MPAAICPTRPRGAFAVRPSRAGASPCATRERITHARKHICLCLPSWTAMASNNLLNGPGFFSISSASRRAMNCRVRGNAQLPQRSTSALRIRRGHRDEPIPKHERQVVIVAVLDALEQRSGKRRAGARREAAGEPRRARDAQGLTDRCPSGQVSSVPPALRLAPFRAVWVTDRRRYRSANGRPAIESPRCGRVRWDDRVAR